MSYKLSKQETTKLFEKLSEKYDIYAPKCFKNHGRYSETDVIKYDKIASLDEVVWDQLVLLQKHPFRQGDMVRFLFTETHRVSDSMQEGRDKRK